MMRFHGLFNREIRGSVEMLFEWIEPYIVITVNAQQILGIKPVPMSQAFCETTGVNSKIKVDQLG